MRTTRSHTNDQLTGMTRRAFGAVLIVIFLLQNALETQCFDSWNFAPPESKEPSPPSMRPLRLKTPAAAALHNSKPFTWSSARTHGQSNVRFAVALRISNPCQEQRDGLIPDYHLACRFFSLCQGGRLVARFQCPNETVFDKASGRCDLSSRLTCDSDRFPADQACANLIDGVYADYKNHCKGFYMCKGGRKLTFSCPEDTRFDWRTSSCRPKDQVTCQTLDCKDKDDGFYADHKDGCKRYFSCVDGEKLEFVCPPGKIYNEVVQTCMSHKHTRCTGDQEFNCHGLPDGYYPQHYSGCRSFHLCVSGHLSTYACPRNRIFNTLSLSCDIRRRAVCSEPEMSECLGKSNGIYPRYDKGCQEFVICRDGYGVLTGVCPQGKLLNPVTGMCQPRDSVVCAPVKDPDCSGRMDGLYPDVTTGCSAFYVCLGQKRIVTTFCPKGQRFDQAMSVCLPANSVICKEMPSPDYLTIASPSIHHFCKGRIGLFPDYFSKCRGYIICAYDHQELVMCPNGTVFDAEEKRCTAGGVICSLPTVISNFKCLSREGIYVDYSRSCRRWYECWDGIGYAYECPEGKRFHPRTSSCEPNHRTSCNPNASTRNDDFGQDDKKQRPISIASKIEKLPGSHFDCSNLPNGVYSSETNCRSFHVCSGGRDFSFLCPADMAFDMDTLSCAPKDKINRCGNEPDSIKFSCIGEADGMYPDYDSNCKRYFVCEKQELRIVYCPDGRIFSSRTMVCEPETTVLCSGPSALELDFKPKQDSSITAFHFMTASPTVQVALRSEANELVQDGFNRNQDVSHPIGTSTRQHVEAVSFECPPGETGFFPDYSSGCKKFYTCFRSLVKSYSCPSVLLFNPYTRTCDLPEMVVCQPPEIVQEEDATYNCTGKQYGFYPDFQSGCRKFYGCLNKEILVFTCPPGRSFSRKTMACNPSSMVTCALDPYEEFESGSRISSGTSLAVKGIRSPVLSRESPMDHVHGIPRQYLFSCAGKADGFYPDYARHCHVFYRCVKGKKFSHYCKQSLLFNPRTEICDFEENVVCSPPEETNVTGR